MKACILENRNKGFRAGALIIKNGKILLMHQYLGPRPDENKAAEDFYTLPGGSWEDGETLEQTCKRELKEEFGIDIEVGKLVFLLDSESRIAFYFECKTESSDIRLGGPEKERMNVNERYSVEWVEISKVAELNFIPAPAKNALIKYIDDPKQNTYFFSTKAEL